MAVKTADQIGVDDVLQLPGWMLHEDLAGLHFEIRPVAMRCDSTRVFVDHLDTNGNSATTWLRPDEEVTVLS
ncbi:hypothetical protein HYX70_00965 [Candidatus Saccharibacteria bacterium]|nr:hypothetical protein [Candidatus Saccharibacteria bacterium]